VQLPVGELVDGERVGPLGVVADTEGEISQMSVFVRGDNDLENHAPGAVGVWNVDLEAVREVPVASFGFAGLQIRSGDAVSLVFASGGFAGRSAGGGGARQVLVEEVGIEARGKAQL
jgi:hypothetical protein